MDFNDILFDFDDLLILPATLTPIRSRKNVSTRYDNGFFPLMTAPMDTVVNMGNFDNYERNGIIPIIPRVLYPEKSWYRTDKFLSYSLDDFEKIFLSEDKIKTYHGNKIMALIDIANGHMEALYEVTKSAKKIYGEDMCLMIGNIANPDTYQKYCATGVDYIRIGIGNGNGCWIEGTLVNTNKGLKKIEDVNINDLVLTHNGKYEPVINKIEYNVNEKLIEINGEICTKNHELYVIHKKDKDLVNDTNYKDYAIFLSADKIDDNYLILSWDEE